jgi:dihydrolipoamide dehydrogenase
MRTIETDVAVIGAGTAGLNARREAELQGARTLLIESGPYGTTCARVGCMPSKLLIAAADSAQEVREAHRFGIEADAPRVNGAAVLDRVRRERDRFVGFVIEDTEALPEEARLRGHARFVDARTLQVDDHTRIEARAIVIATGSTPRVPQELEAVRSRLLVTDTVFELEDLPRSLAVVGTGVIALELGQAFHRLGVRIVLLGRSGRLGPLTDPEVESAARAALGGELDIRAARGLSGEPTDGGARLHWKENGVAEQGDFEFVLVAAGRSANTNDLGLENTDLVLDGHGVPVHDPRTGQCGDSPIFLAGDATGTRPILHEAADEGRIAGRNAAHFPEVRAHQRRSRLDIVFTNPQLAIVGTPYRELDLESVTIGAVDYGDQGRARVMARNAGLVRVYAESDGRLLGAELVGPRVEHTAHLLAWAVQQRMNVQTLLQMPFYHPVIEEGIRTALRGAARQLLYERAPCAHELDCGPGA